MGKIEGEGVVYARVAGLFFSSHPAADGWQTHPTYFLLGFSAALAPKFPLTIYGLGFASGYWFTSRMWWCYQSRWREVSAFFMPRCFSKGSYKRGKKSPRLPDLRMRRVADYLGDLCAESRQTFKFTRLVLGCIEAKFFN